MGKESYALATGLFVLALGAAMVAAGIWLGHYGEERDVYIVVTQSSVSGLNPESTVLYRGVQVGKVSTIRFDPSNAKNITVQIEVDKGLPITRGTYAKLRVQGLTGLAQIELGDSGDDPRPLTTDSADPAQIPLHPSLIDKLSNSMDNILLGSEQLITHLNDLLDQGSRQRFKETLNNLEVASGRLAELEAGTGKALSEMNRAAAAIREAGTEARLTGAQAQKALSKIDELTIDVQQLSGSVRSLAVSGKTATDSFTDSSLPRLNEALEELRGTSRQIRTLTELLASDPQMLIYGRQPPEPGPGEPGYSEPSK